MSLKKREREREKEKDASFVLEAASLSRLDCARSSRSLDAEFRVKVSPRVPRESDISLTFVRNPFRFARRYRGRGSSGKKLLVVRSISKEDGEVPTGIVTRRIANAFVFEYVTSPARLATVQRSASRHRPA